MSSPPLASTDELETWIGSPLVDEDRAEAKLRAASALVRTYKGVTYLDGDGALLEVPDNVWTVTLMVAERLLTGPTGAVQRQSDSIDGYSTDTTYATNTGALNDVEKALLGGFPSTLSSVKVTAPAYPNSYQEWDQVLESDDA